LNPSQFHFRKATGLGPDRRAHGHTGWGDKDGFRLLVDVSQAGEVRGWSRHGTDLTTRLGSLLAPFTPVAPGTTFDGELVAVSERDGKPTQDFAAVTRGVFTGKPAAMDRLRFVAFDLLAVAGDDVRACPWEERDARLRETLPVCKRIRPAASQPATLAAHEGIVALGFEGTVLKRLGSAYRPGRHRTWIKRKARFVARAELRSVRQDREGRWHALCELDGRRVHALASARTRELIGEPVDLVYSRVDADGSLREARVAPAP
jgi:ATP-dependent DNA ligase